MRHSSRLGDFVIILALFAPVKGIAVTSAARSKALPDLPTIAESGVPGYDVSAWFGLFAPARVPSALITKLQAEARTALLNPDVARRMQSGGTDVVGNPPQEFAAEVKKEFAKWRVRWCNARAACA